MNDDAKTGEARAEFVILVPGNPHQGLLMEVARVRGLGATVPGRSRQKVVLHGSEEKVRAIVDETAKLGRLYDIRTLQALEQLLLESGLRVPLALARALSVSQFKAAVAAGLLSKKADQSSERVQKGER